MLSLFPSLFTFEAFGPVVLRVALAITLIIEASALIKKSRSQTDRAIGFGEALMSALLVLGFITQLVAIVSALFVAYEAWRGKRRNLETAILIIGICIALIVIGPGLLAIDYPF